MTSEPLRFYHQDFWQFSLSHYAQAGVQSACLCLQNSYQGNVNLALLLHWLDCQHQSLTDSSQHQLITCLGASDNLLQQYRTMRDQLKPLLDEAGYKQLLAFELKLEKGQQQALIAQLNLCLLQQTPHHGSTDNLKRYCEQLGASQLLPQLTATN
ncbi:TIGR02444 family protein [Photobacterium lipolyticum]|uniref:TIGR02444 family protein n=1 Tax=Photobacterium lipolyticum TaxID=266810 RepID=A0A2T3MYB9_9GAMM|nr:TIGR02444 family protein [Photobacterium lipolyticum]PSW04841.1 TIGR02444 family protein [Photobacterium lipolyticum]